MKRAITALGFSLLALTANAVDYGAPFSQLEIDRALLPTIDFAPVDRYIPDARAPYDQVAIARPAAKPTPAFGNRFAPPSTRLRFAEDPAKGKTLTDTAATDEPRFEPPWANDDNFIAPAQ
jgi:hypothetical protein